MDYVRIIKKGCYIIWLALLLPILLKMLLILLTSYLIGWVIELIIKRPIPEEAYLPISYPTTILFQVLLWLLAHLVGRKSG